MKIIEKPIWRPPWVPHLYGGEHLEATLDVSLIWGEASGGPPGSLTYMGGSIWKPPWMFHLYGGKHLEATLGPSLIWREASGSDPGSLTYMEGGASGGHPGSLTYRGRSIWRPPWISHLYEGKHLEASEMA
jgi:hypothetical protein